MDPLRRTARDLAVELGDDRIVEEPVEVGALERDMGEPPALLARLLGPRRPAFGVRPRRTEEVAVALRRLLAEGIPVTPRGLSSTGLGGAVPVAGGAVLDLSGLTGLVEVDVAGRRVTVRAGTPFYFLQRALERHGLSLLARPTNAFGTLGGWAASGGIGLGSLGAGPLREHVESAECVLPDGEIQQLSAGEEGFDDLFDTEGQLAVLTHLTLRAGVAADHLEVLGMVFPSVADALAATEDVFSDSGLRTVVLAGSTADHPALDRLAGGVEGTLVVMEGPAGARWPRPEDHGGRPLPEAATRHLHQRRFFPLDVPHGPLFLASEALLPPSRVAPFLERAERLAARYRVPLHTHAHAVVVDGRPAYLVLLAYPTDPGHPTAHLLRTPLTAALTVAAIDQGGRPYGVGIWNTPFAPRCVGTERYRALWERKRALDPRGLLNPGKFFQVGTGARLLPALMHRGAFPALVRLAASTAPVLALPDPAGEHATTTAERCISCGACVPVCPAVAATGCESVSARAKLGLMRRLAAGERPSDAELLGSQRCLECGQCAEVCARGLPLVEAWRELEQRVRGLVDDDEAFRRTLTTFAARVDAARDRVVPVSLP